MTVVEDADYHFQCAGCGATYVQARDACREQRAEMTTATKSTIGDAARVIWNTDTVDLGGVTVRDAHTIAQALADAGLLRQP